MFVDCFIKECPFCLIADITTADKLCGIGKGNSMVKDIESCNGKQPVYKKGKGDYDQRIISKSLGRKKNIATKIADTSGTNDIFPKG